MTDEREILILGRAPVACPRCGIEQPGIEFPYRMDGTYGEECLSCTDGAYRSRMIAQGNRTEAKRSWMTDQQMGYLHNREIDRLTIMGLIRGWDIERIQEHILLAAMIRQSGGTVWI